MLATECVSPPERHPGFLAGAIDFGVRAIFHRLHVHVVACSLVGHHRVLLHTFGLKALHLQLQVVVQPLESVPLLQKVGAQRVAVMQVAVEDDFAGAIKVEDWLPYGMQERKVHPVAPPLAESTLRAEQ